MVSLCILLLYVVLSVSSSQVASCIRATPRYLEGMSLDHTPMDRPRILSQLAVENSSLNVLF
jgi:hypothetical protein